MCWWKIKPKNYCVKNAKELLYSVNEWWRAVESLEGKSDEFHVLEFGRLTIYLFGSAERGQKEYNKRYGHTKKMPSTVGFNVIKGLKEKPETLEFDIWLPFEKGKIINPWGCGHEVAHIFQYLLDFKNPDKILEEEYYE